MVKVGTNRANNITEKVVEKAVGRNPTLATMANYMRAQIAVVGVAKVRQNVMKAIDSDIQKALQNNTEPEAARKELFDLLQTAMQTTEYAKLLEAVDLGEEHAKIMINEAVDKKWTPTLTIIPPPASPTLWEKLLAQLKESWNRCVAMLKEKK